MYIELFLLDDLLLNLLIMRLAAAMLSVRPPMCRMLIFGLASALVSAAAAYIMPILRSLPFRIPLLALCSAGLPARSVRAFLRNMGAVLLATLTSGGCAAALALLTGGGVREGFLTGGIALRTAVLTALAVSFLPSAARRILRRRLRNENLAEVVILHDGTLRRFTAIVDTGNSLSEPVTALPVAVVRCHALARYAKLPISAGTAAGREVLMAFRPERISVNGNEVDCMVAVTGERLGADALIPPDIVL